MNVNLPKEVLHKLRTDSLAQISLHQAVIMEIDRALAEGNPERKPMVLARGWKRVPSGRGIALKFVEKLAKEVNGDPAEIGRALKKPKRVVSAAARRKMARAQRKRWKLFKAQKKAA